MNKIIFYFFIGANFHIYTADSLWVSICYVQILCNDIATLNVESKGIK